MRMVFTGVQKWKTSLSRREIALTFQTAYHLNPVIQPNRRCCQAPCTEGYARTSMDCPRHEARGQYGQMDEATLRVAQTSTAFKRRVSIYFSLHFATWNSWRSSLEPAFRDLALDAVTISDPFEPISCTDSFPCHFLRVSLSSLCRGDSTPHTHTGLQLRIMSSLRTN